MGRMVFAGVLAGALALSFASSGATQGPADLSGTWEGSGFDLAAGAKGPGPVTNVSSDIQKPEGDDKNPILQPWAAAIVKRWAEETHAGHPPAHAHALCYPTSLPGVMTLHNAYQFLQSPDKVTIIIANQTQARHIYLNVPHSKHVTPSWYGESVGHYEGDTLVVDTVGIKTMDVVPLDRFGTPHTEKLHVVERIRKLSAKELRIDYRIEDPGAFTMAWDAVALFHPFAEWDEETCAENNVDQTGKLEPRMPVDMAPAF